jgi:putative ABC transport system permease protein
MWLKNAVKNWTGRRRADAELDEEVRGYVEMVAEDKVRNGADVRNARREAKMEAGGVEQMKEQAREVRAGHLLETLWQDIRYGARMLRKAPGFTAVAVLTLALGIGANTAIFSVIENVMFRALPFTAPDQIVRIYSTENGTPITPSGSGRPGGPSPADFLDFAARNHTFQQMAVYDTWRKNVSFGDSVGEPEQVWVGLMPGAYFKALDVKPIMGRFFTANESYKGKHYIAAISEELWKNRYGGDKEILGKKIRINDETYTIVAVMPDVIPEWMEEKTVQVWTPFGFADALSDLWTESGRRGRGYGALGRIKPGVSIQQAQADLSTIAASLAAEHPVDRGIGVKLERLSDTRARNLRSILFLLMGAVSLILLIACVNLANLLLARNSVRERELAMRAALGAGRKRLVRQLLAETLLLACLGGGAGLLLAELGITALTRMRPADLPQLSSIGIDWRVLVFTVFVSLVTSVIFGLGPALNASRLNLAESLKLGGRSGTAGSNAPRMRNALVVVEMAMSLMLLIGATLLIQSVVHLQRQQLGIRAADHLLTGHFYLPPVHYTNPGAITRFSDQFAEKIRALPGVVDASITTIWPPTYNWSQMFEIAGRPVTRQEDVPSAQCGFTDAHFLQTMGIPLVRGREFSQSDTPTSPAVVLVSQEFVRQYFAHQDPIGQRMHIGPPAFLNIPPGSDIDDSSDVTIVGIIGDFRNNGLASPPEPQIIALYSQHPLVTYSFRDVVVRTAADPHLMIPEITRQLHSMDADLPFAQAQTIEDAVELLTGGQRFTTALLVIFAVIGLALAAVGIYGVVSFLVAQRTHEMAIRLAIGASGANVLWLVLRQGLQMALAGAAAGLIGAWAARKMISGLLFGISTFDPLTLAGATIFLLLLVAVACSAPAWRASRVDPCVALRSE